MAKVEISNKSRIMTSYGPSSWTVTSIVWGVSNNGLWQPKVPRVIRSEVKNVRKISNPIKIAVRKVSEPIKITMRGV
jgi:hypothetical protein